MQTLAANILMGISIVKNITAIVKLGRVTRMDNICIFFVECKEIRSMFRLGTYESYSRSHEAIWTRFALLMTSDQLLTSEWLS